MLAAWLQEGAAGGAGTLALVLFVVYLCAMIGIGVWAAARGRGTEEDYFLGGRKVSSFVVALSAVSSGRSAWLVTGASGAAWAMGLSALWIFPGYILAEFLLMFTVGRRLREESQRIGAITIPEVLGELTVGRGGARGGSKRAVQAVCAIVVVLFLVTYVSAQLAAGGKALGYLLPTLSADKSGLVVSAVIVLVYTFLGGYRAVALTDVLQALLMLVALVALPLLGLVMVGGPAELLARLREIDPVLLDPVTSVTGLIGGLAIGLGSLGNPPILVRAMSIEDPGKLKHAARIGLAWNVVMALGAFGIGLVGRALFADAGQFPDGDREYLFVLLGTQVSAEYLFAGFAGILLAALFAAIMSTCDSQLLVIASSLLRDFRGADAPADRGSGAGRMTVAVALLAAVVLSYGAAREVHTFVLFSWAALGAAFGPPLLFLFYDRRTSARGVIAGVVAGAVTVVVWGQVPALDAFLYELVPGFAASALAVWLLRARPAT